MTKPVVVGIADCKVSDDPQSELVTYALGSCVAVMIHDPHVRVGGLLHFMLPESGIDRVKAQDRPFMFADTGIPLLFHSAYAKGAEKRRLLVSVAGGAQMMDDRGVFNIGKRNCLAVRKILWKAGVMVQSENLGGTDSRTVRMDVATGKISLSEGGDRLFGKAGNGSAPEGVRNGV
jgi:chemotaxis protein CheD